MITDIYHMSNLQLKNVITSLKTKKKIKTKVKEMKEYIIQQKSEKQKIEEFNEIKKLII